MQEPSESKKDRFLSRNRSNVGNNQVQEELYYHDKDHHVAHGTSEQGNLILSKLRTISTVFICLMHSFNFISLIEIYLIITNQWKILNFPQEDVERRMMRKL